MSSDSHSKLQAAVREGGWTESSVDDCLIRGGPGLVACTATALVTPLMLGCYEQLGPGPRRIGWGMARAIEDTRIADDAARLRKLRRLRLRAVVLTIDQLLEELELLNLQGRSRSLSAWHRRLFSLGRLKPEAIRFELNSESSPQHLMDRLFELQERLMRDFAGPEWDLSVDGESSRECACQVSRLGDRDGSSPSRRGLPAGEATRSGDCVTVKSRPSDGGPSKAARRSQAGLRVSVGG